MNELLNWELYANRNLYIITHGQRLGHDWKHM